MIQLRGVSKTVQSGGHPLTILHPLDYDVADGQCVAIIGPSGSGKSTLLGLIAGLDAATTGSIVIAGQDITKLDEDSLAKLRGEKIGFVFQFFHLLPTLTCLENVGLPLHLAGWPRRDVTGRARELLSLVQLEHRTNHVPEQLSGGQRQRVAIARALAASPQILLGDEPTGNLDTRTGQEILGLLRDLHERLGATVVIVTHDMNVARTCNRIVTMQDGGIVGDTAA